MAGSLALFHTLTGPVLRDAEGGADTTVWLSAVRPAPPSGGLWHDRRERPTHMQPRTRSTAADTDWIWAWVCEQTSLDGSPT
ncbi:MAG: hypothetical protein ACR2FG_00420 [Marmoricola sp.]